CKSSRALHGAGGAAIEGAPAGSADPQGYHSSSGGRTMRKALGIAIATTAAVLFAGIDAQAQDEAQAVADGGIAVPGWTGQIDAREAEQGQVLENAKLAPEGDGMRVTTGPAVSYWNPENTASGNYTVSATFTEPEYMSINDHPHPYG